MNLSRYGTLAQVVEQWTENPCVLGSTPRGTTSSFHSIRFPCYAGPDFFYFQLIYSFLCGLKFHVFCCYGAGFTVLRPSFDGRQQCVRRLSNNTYDGRQQRCSRPSYNQLNVVNTETCCNKVPDEQAVSGCH